MRFGLIAALAALAFFGCGQASDPAEPIDEDTAAKVARKIRRAWPPAAVA